MVAAVRGEQTKRGKSPTRASDPAKKPQAAGLPVDPRIALVSACGVLVLGLTIFMFTGDRPASIERGVHNAVAQQFAKLGFKITSLHLQGASPAAKSAIIQAAGLYQDEPIMSVDLKAVRARVEAIGWVEEARVVRLLPDTVVIHVKEQAPAAVWQQRGQLRVIDASGKVIPDADPGRYPQLPLLVGQGANEAAGLTQTDGSDILSMIRARPRLNERLEALVRVDNRRWDLRLKDGAIVQLPAVGEEAALIQLDRLDQSQRVLELGFERIDLRTPEMVVVRRRDVTVPGQLIAGGV